MPLLSMNYITTYLFLTMEDVIRVVERFQHCCPLIPAKNCRVLVQKGKEKMTTAGTFWPDKHLFEILPSRKTVLVHECSTSCHNTFFPKAITILNLPF